jgi:hypothetical protein
MFWEKLKILKKAGSFSPKNKALVYFSSLEIYFDLFRCLLEEVTLNYM